MDLDFGILMGLVEAQSCLDDGDYEGASRVFDRMLKDHPDNPAILFGKALCLYNMGQYDEALNYCEKARAIDEDAVPVDFYNQLKYKTGDNPFPESPHKKKKRSEESKIPAILKSGVNLIKKHEYNKANSFFDRALKIDDKNTDAIVCRAYCISNLGRKSLALSMCDKIDRYELNVDFLSFYDELMNIEADDAMPQNRPSNDEVTRLCDEGFEYVRKVEFKNALKCFNKASKIDSEDVNPIIGQAYCSFYLGYYVKALKECRLALSMDITSVDRKFYRQVKFKADGE